MTKAVPPRSWEKIHSMIEGMKKQIAAKSRHDASDYELLFDLGRLSTFVTLVEVGAYVDSSVVDSCDIDGAHVQEEYARVWHTSELGGAIPTMREIFS